MLFLLFYIWLFRGALGLDKPETIPVTEGDSVSLNTGLSEVQKNLLIIWTFRLNSSEIIVAKIDNQAITARSENTIFKDRLQIDQQTGSLAITNITRSHSGLYKQQILTKEIIYKTFYISVYGVLTHPVITRDSLQNSSSSSCSLLCSVVNVSRATLSWLKGNSLLSSISASDLSISLSLPLEVEDQENNTYSCVINNPIRHQATHLDIRALCHTSSESNTTLFLIVASILLLLLLLITILAMFIHRKKNYTQAKQEAQTYEEDVDYTDATFIPHRVQEKEADERDHTVYSEVFVKC